MKWKNAKFWLWIEIFFPIEDEECESIEGPQGSQWEDCGFEPDCTTPICFDILSFSSEFELNSIPTAVVSAAIGRRADDPTNAAEIHRWVSEMQLQLKARVWCMAMTTATSDPDDTGTDLWPAEKFMVFDGYVTGSGFRRNNNGAELTLALTHWLTDLNFSSALSKQTHPLNPGQLYFPANFVLNAGAAGGALFAGQPGPMQTGMHMAMPFFSVPMIQEDFWGGFESDAPGNPRILSGMKDWLLFLTKHDHINAAQILALVGPGSVVSNLIPEKNWEACRALRRFEPNAEYNDFVEEGYILGVPLRLSDQGDLNEFIANSIGTEIGQETLEAYSNTTLWDKLAGQFHANYMFSVVPLVEKALIVPFVPGLVDEDGDDGLVHRVIRTTHYEAIDISAAMPRPLRAVGVLIGKNNSAGGHLTGDEAANYSGGFGGWYDKMTDSTDPRFKEGLIIFKEGPRWMSNFVSNYVYTPRSTGQDGTLQTIASTNAGNPHAADTPSTILENAASVWDLYARTLYIHEVLKARQGTITGHVRFDIAPGSQLKVELSEDKFVREILHPTTPEMTEDEICLQANYSFVYCSVLRVSTLIDCQNQTAYTSYHVGHIRSELENSDPSTSIDRHPLWQGCRWGGCVLVQDEAFEFLSTTDCEELE